MGVARPTVLLAVRTVGRIAVDEVAAVRSERKLLDRVQQMVRAGERAGRLESRVDDLA